MSRVLLQRSFAAQWLLGRRLFQLRSSPSVLAVHVEHHRCYLARHSLLEILTVKLLPARLRSCT